MNKAEQTLDVAIENAEVRALYQVASTLNGWNVQQGKKFMSTTSDRHAYEIAICELLQKLPPNSAPVGALLCRWAASLRDDLLTGMEDISDCDDENRPVCHDALMGLFTQFTKK